MAWIVKTLVGGTERLPLSKVVAAADTKWVHVLVCTPPVDALADDGLRPRCCLTVLFQVALTRASILFSTTLQPGGFLPRGSHHRRQAPAAAGGAAQCR